MKLVVFNGRLSSAYGCTAPTNFIFGKTYAVKGVECRDTYTAYIIQGFEGYFNADCFDDIDAFPTYFAFAEETPTIGERYRILKLDPSNNFVSRKTSTVRYVDRIANNTYKIITRNSIYIVKIR